MPKPGTPATPKTLAFSSSRELGEWLRAHHATERELLVKIFKKGSGVPSVTWEDVVIEALCWGWIDSVKRSLDDRAYLQRITPRKAGSNWSKLNTRHVDRLLAEGRMQEPGLVHVRAAKADGRWDKAYAVSEMMVPEDFLAALEKNPKAKRFYETLNKSDRFVIAYRLADAKRPETREKRFKEFLERLGRGVKPGAA